MKKPMKLNVQIGRDSPKTGLEDPPLQIYMKQKTRECKNGLRECRARRRVNDARRRRFEANRLNILLRMFKLRNLF